MLAIKQGATDQTVYIFVQDSSETTGVGLTGLVHNTASLTAYYVRNRGSATQITLATLAAANSAHSDGGFKEVDATNMPGIYRLDLPDAACASGADEVIVFLKGATDMAPVAKEILLTAVDLQDGVRMGMTALPNAAADAAGGLPISDAGGLDLDGMNTNVSSILTDTGTTLDGKLNTIDTVVDAIKVVTDKLDDTLELDSTVYRFTTNALEQAPSGGGSLTAQQVWEYNISAISTAGYAGTIVNAILTDTAVIGAAGAGLTAVPWNAAWDAEVQSEVTDALNAYDPPTNAEMVARTIASASYATATALATVDTEVGALQTDITAILADTNELQTNQGNWLTADVSSLATAAALAVVDGNVDSILEDTATTIPATLTTISGYIDTEVAAIKSVTDNLPNGGALTSLASAAALATVDTVVDAIKVKTDSLTFTVSGQVDSNIQYVNDVQVAGTGADGNEWGPV